MKSDTQKEEKAKPETLTPLGQRSEETGNLRRFVSILADEMAWNWCHNFGNKRDAADAVLHLMARIGLIEYYAHPLGGNIWRVGDKFYGRIDEDAEPIIASLRSVESPKQEKEEKNDTAKTN